MLGVEDYGSDSDNEYSPNAPTPAKETDALPFKHPAPVKPATTGSKATIKAKRPAKKIAIGLPTLPAEPEDDLDAGRPPVKKQRLHSGAGSSSLLSMLPAPKQADPVVPPPERVLGAGRRPGLVFDNSRSINTPAFPLVDNTASEDVDDSTDPRDTLEVESTTLFRPTSLKRANISVEERSEPPKKVLPKVSSPPPTNFFSLGSYVLLRRFSFTLQYFSESTSTSSSKLVDRNQILSVTEASSSSVAGLRVLSAAPKVDDFTPPEPTPTDPYPGYYLLPSGSWAAYEPAYYKSFYKKWQDEYNAHVRALEKGKVKGFEDLEASEAQEVDAAKEMEKAKKEIQEREEKKALTRGAGKGLEAPRMNIKVSSGFEH